MKDYLKQRGFTLIELLVVIAIIGILASVLYASFDGARDNARNKAMMAEFKEVQLALEVYKAQNDSYPSDIDDLVPDFISVLPVPGDSGNPDCTLQYLSPTGSWYKYTGIECYSGAESAITGVTRRDRMARCPESCGSSPARCDPSDELFYESFAVYSVGGQCE